MLFLLVPIVSTHHFQETRHQLLKLRPTQRGSWIGLVLSYHLLKEYDTALGVLAEYRATQKPADEVSRYVLKV